MYWLPRSLAIFFISFLMIFSFDVFSMEGSFLTKIGGFLIHNIPVFFLTFLLILAWKKEKIGGLLFMFTGIVMTIFFRTYQDISTLLLISAPPIVIGVLFFL